MSNTHHGAESFGICIDNASIHDWTVVQISQTLLDKIPDIIKWVTNRLITRVKERIYDIRTIDEIVRTAQEWELKKRKQTQDQTLPTTTKRFKHANSRPEGQRGPQCSNYRESHEGSCCALVFFRCGEEGHYGWDCKQETLGVHVCFHYNHKGHIKTNYHVLKTTSAMQAPAPEPFRRTNGRLSE